MDKKYTFIEFMSALQDADFDVINDKKLTCGRNFMKVCFEELENSHDGDCTKSSHPCLLCALEHYLIEYKEYTFDEKKWRNLNGL